MRNTWMTALAAAALLAACDGSSGPDDRDRLSLSFNGLEPLAGGAHYEGWAMIGGTPVSTGKFDVDASGNVVSVSGAAVPGGDFDAGRDLRAATAIIVTVEPAGDTDAVPAATKMMAGEVSGGTATLTVAAPQALGNAFTSATGTYILATPTNGMGTSERSGIWFIDPSSGMPMPGLSLAALPAGWKYEGWSVIGGTPVSTGTFTAVNTADAAAPFSGPMAGPPFPGEDFLANAPSGLAFPTDLRGTMAVISIEPDPDDSPAPFALKPLVGMVPAGAMDHTPYPMTNQAGTTFPTGTARIAD